MKGFTMKYLLALLLIPTLSLADTVNEMYVSLEPTVQLVITNAPCKMFKAPENVQLNFAYAVNISTGDTVEGCFGHIGDVIHIELKDENNNFYSYKIGADNFVVRTRI